MVNLHNEILNLRDGEHGRSYGNVFLSIHFRMSACSQSSTMSTLMLHRKQSFDAN